jgi:dGTPase
VPPTILEALGPSHARRIDTIVRDVVAQSATDHVPGTVRLSAPLRAAADALGELLLARVYTPLNLQPDTRRAQHIVQALFAHFAADPDRIPPEFAPPDRDDPPDRRAADYVASMTDRYAIDRYEQIWLPRRWSV